MLPDGKPSSLFRKYSPSLPKFKLMKELSPAKQWDCFLARFNPEIVTLVKGALARMRPWRSASACFDFPVANNNIVILPYDTNMAWMHEIVRSKRDAGRRISVTLRAFEANSQVLRGTQSEP